jgi:putative ribosome biogenesis GTPase RsgA
LLLDIVTTTTTEAIGMTGAMQPEEVAQCLSNKKIKKATPDFVIWTKDLVSAVKEIYYKTVHPVIQTSLDRYQQGVTAYYYDIAEKVVVVVEANPSLTSIALKQLPRWLQAFAHNDLRYPLVTKAYMEDLLDVWKEFDSILQEVSVFFIYFSATISLAAELKLCEVYLLAAEM